ncbi:esterase-like activity of phytase family protein [Goekera deserti]|uniref:esterase-like activity of phytase family protein n=1 Tax=Goekera deserti TaxID=2497753 RepID=UPI00192ED2D4|nr:esterase-like activity of phytase family protein [Goekera deserti]
MRTRPRGVLVAAAVGLTLTASVSPASAHRAAEPTLLSRALLSATAYQPGPPSGAATTPANGVTPPYPGQPVPGFSAVLPAEAGRSDGRHLLAMPDNGYGAKGNSADFLLRIYDISLDPRTAGGRGTGQVTVNGFLSLRDPDGHVPFPIVNEDTPDRLLTGADFDIESLQRDGRGDLWVGEEFGPYLLHLDATGKVLQAPVPLPDGRKSPASPDLAPGEVPTVRSSRGFEAMAAAPGGRYLYPILEGALTDDPDQRRRVVYEFDTRTSAYTDRTWSIRLAEPQLVVGDAQVLGGGRRLLFIERDDFEGPEARVKRLVVADLDCTDAAGYASRRVAVDLLDIADPGGVSSPARPGEFGVGPEFSFPLTSVESLLPLGGNRVLVANDNNFPGNDGRIAGRPDDTELIVLDVPGLRGR